MTRQISRFDLLHYTLGEQTYVLRRYAPPGMYEGGLMIDPFASLSDWSDEEAGDVDGIGAYSCVRGPFADDSFEYEEAADFTDDERAFLKAIAGAITFTSSFGFVDVEYYETLKELTTKWDEIRAEADAFDDKVRADNPEEERSKLAMPKTTFGCDQCQMLSINGLACHETGCPNASKSWKDGRWERIRECPECGAEILDDEGCGCTTADVEDYDLEEGAARCICSDGFGMNLSCAVHGVRSVT